MRDTICANWGTSSLKLRKVLKGVRGSHHFVLARIPITSSSTDAVKADIPGRNCTWAADLAHPVTQWSRNDRPATFGSAPGEWAVVTSGWRGVRWPGLSRVICRAVRFQPRASSRPQHGAQGSARGSWTASGDRHGLGPQGAYATPGASGGGMALGVLSSA
jgi:hypothetical protein